MPPTPRRIPYAGKAYGQLRHWLPGTPPRHKRRARPPSRLDPPVARRFSRPARLLPASCWPVGRAAKPWPALADEARPPRPQVGDFICVIIPFAVLAHLLFLSVGYWLSQRM